MYTGVGFTVLPEPPERRGFYWRQPTRRVVPPGIRGAVPPGIRPAVPPGIRPATRSFYWRGMRGVGQGEEEVILGIEKPSLPGYVTTEEHEAAQAEAKKKYYIGLGVGAAGGFILGALLL